MYERFKGGIGWKYSWKWIHLVITAVQQPETLRRLWRPFTSR